MTPARTGGSPPPCRIDISQLPPGQIVLLRRVLDAGDVPYAIVQSDVIAAAPYASEIERAVRWVAIDTAPPEAFDDPEYRSDRAPLVRPSRPPLADGRRAATRYRRLGAGLLDEVLVGVPTALASHAGAPVAWVAALHMFYFCVPTGLFGWSIGKLWAGTRVVEVHSLARPAWWRVVVRWIVPYSPVLAGLVIGLPGDVIGPLVALTYLPIMWDLRGAHDRAAGTTVVERSVAGPGVWVRRSAVGQNA